MRYSTIRSLFLFILTACIGVLTPIVAAQAQNPVPPAGPASQAPAPSQPTSLCANRPLCYDANDFVATVTEFRTSTAGNGAKVLDAMVHFVNKTNQAISLGYLDGSGAAIDDMGNRFVLNTWGGGIRGMGVVSGNNMDPKFTLPPGGGADARFELWWAPYGKLAGVNYEMEFSLREMNRVEGNQWTLGDETLIHYQGLANGMGVAPTTGGNSFAAGSSAMGAGGVTTSGGAVSSLGSAVNTYVPGVQANNSGQVAPTTYVAAGQPCPPGTSPSTSGAATAANAVGQQNQNASNAISNAASAISSFGALFKKKSASQNTAATTPCIATTNTASPMATPAGTTSVNPTASAVTTRTASGTIVPAPGTANINTPQIRTVNPGMPAKAAQPTATGTNAKPAANPPVSRPLTNASLKQPASSNPKPSPAKPATTKPATTKPASSTTTNNTQSH
jgi:hypothetical protein